MPTITWRHPAHDMTPRHDTTLRRHAVRGAADLHYDIHHCPTSPIHNAHPPSHLCITSFSYNKRSGRLGTPRIPVSSRSQLYKSIRVPPTNRRYSNILPRWNTPLPNPESRPRHCIIRLDTTLACFARVRTFFSGTVAVLPPMPLSDSPTKTDLDRVAPPVSESTMHAPARRWKVAVSHDDSGLPPYTSPDPHKERSGLAGPLLWRISTQAMGLS